MGNEISAITQALAAANSTYVMPSLLAVADTTTSADTSPLLNAVQINDAALVARLLDEGENPNSSNENGCTPLMTGAAAGHRAIVDVLLARGATMDLVDKNGDYALYTAAMNGLLEIVQLLVEHGATVAPTNVGEDLPILVAYDRGHDNVVVYLITKMDNLNISSNGGPFLLRACGDGRISVVDALLLAGADCNAANSHGITPLMGAAYLGHTAIVARLLQETLINVDAEDESGRTAIFCAVQSLQTTDAPLAILSMLLAAGANVDSASDHGHTALYLAAMLGSVEILQLLVAHGANVAHIVETPVPTTAVAMASVQGHAAAVRYLLEMGAPIDIPDANGATALFCACELGNIEFVRALVEHTDCDINAADNDGNTPLHAACWHGFTDVVSYLLAQQPRLNVMAENLVSQAREDSNRSH
ncbi:hypothetical protein SPRG_15513 [Saprolegnia parasitica CBS 223.65]|uniref:Uncharacterized protein n=1 Tax=Saprolegnia parasitica (strain CBS 223.65) TaxID=695850 RepID=A0A067BKM5_SAPPC|nr:hypothetical protein SPRG_15513 [Saprolegnia parasitica CBS 223.65]KDO18723.1 hypothetical protein SPRG_15513 [Saprolegnia parasitica CBS 223.65]|eukprot:XP_012210569.1 hypothetical protein SPRG_15513 [Saprolegnia parasitica CBS 223.65]